MRLQYSEIVVEAIEPLFPEPAIFLEPVVGFLERARLDPAGPHLRVAAARDQAGALEHLQMLGDRRQAHVERLGELQHRRFAEREPRKDGAPRRVGKGREGGAEAVGHRIEPFG